MYSILITTQDVVFTTQVTPQMFKINYLQFRTAYLDPFKPFEPIKTVFV